MFRILLSPPTYTCSWVKHDLPFKISYYVMTKYWILFLSGKKTLWIFLAMFPQKVRFISLVPKGNTKLV